MKNGGGKTAGNWTGTTKKQGGGKLIGTPAYTKGRNCMIGTVLGDCIRFQFLGLFKAERDTPLRGA